MSRRPDELLDRASRCLLAVGAGSGPTLSPMAFWSDGAGLWMLTSRSAVGPASVRRAPDCVAYVPPLDPDAPGAVVAGRARVFGSSEPLGLVLHAPTISAAMTALTARSPGSMVGYVQDAVRVAPRMSSGNRVVLRLTVDRLHGIDEPPAGPGVAPALPTVVPLDVRRAVAGVRRVVVAFHDGQALRVAPAVWSAGYALAAQVRIPEGARVAVAVGLAAGPTVEAGATVHGRVGPDQRLVPEKTTWWHGVEVATAPVTAPAPGGVELPD